MNTWVLAPKTSASSVAARRRNLPAGSTWQRCSHSLGQMTQQRSFLSTAWSSSMNATMSRPTRSRRRSGRYRHGAGSGSPRRRSGRMAVRRSCSCTADRCDTRSRVRRTLSRNCMFIRLPPRSVTTSTATRPASFSRSSSRHSCRTGSAPRRSSMTWCTRPDVAVTAW